MSFYIGGRVVCVKNVTGYSYCPNAPKIYSGDVLTVSDIQEENGRVWLAFFELGDAYVYLSTRFAPLESYGDSIAERIEKEIEQEQLQPA